MHGCFINPLSIWVHCTIATGSSGGDLDTMSALSGY